MSQQKTAIVTGGGTGLGRACAAGLAAKGWRVAVVGRRPQPLEETAEALNAEHGADRVIAIPADLGDAEQAQQSVRDAVGELGRLDAFVSNAAVYYGTPFIDMDAEAWDGALNTNLRGAALGAAEAARQMREQASGRIVLVSSVDGVTSPAESSQYSVAKAGLMALGRSMAVDLAQYGIQVNTVAPGWMRTPMAEEFLESLSEEWLRNISLIGRVMEPEEVAEVITYLVTEAPTVLMGSTVFVDAGHSVISPLP